MWLTFICNHAKAIVACDFLVVVTARFRIRYVFVIMGLGSRKILHHHGIAHPTAEWTLQQFWEALPGGHPYRFVIHDRDSIFSPQLDQAVADMGVRILRTPVRAPQVSLYENASWERYGGNVWTSSSRWVSVMSGALLRGGLSIESRKPTHEPPLWYSGATTSRTTARRTPSPPTGRPSCSE